AKRELTQQGVSEQLITVHVRAHIRYAGTDMPLVVAAGPLASMKTAFEQAHRARFGFIDETKSLVVEAVSVEAVGGGARFAEPTHPTTAAPLPAPARRTQFYSGGAWRDADVFTRDQLMPGHRVTGPAIIIEPHQTIVVETGWRAEITVRNHLVLERVTPLPRT